MFWKKSTRTTGFIWESICLERGLENRNNEAYLGPLKHYDKQAER